jgi:hypothetical protein
MTFVTKSVADQKNFDFEAEDKVLDFTFNQQTFFILIPYSLKHDDR